MSNRLLGILVMISIIGAGFLLYYIKYIPYKQAKIQAETQNQKAEIEIHKEPKMTQKIVEEIKLSPAEKIDELRTAARSYKAFKLDNSSNAYFVEERDGLDLFYDKTKIGNFNLVYPQYLLVDTISGTEKDLYIVVGKEKFYYNNGTKTIQKIELNIDVNYVKKGLARKLIFVTDKGSFVYSTSTKSLEYFSYFNDFVYHNNGYIGLINENDERILNNLGLKADTKNLVVYYNSQTKEKKIIHETNLNIKKIYIYNDKVYLITDDGELFELENI
ncbi:MAG: hypothetical protein QM490_04305 [Candidatus Gracilibacteria bacterium]